MNLTSADLDLKVPKLVSAVVSAAEYGVWSTHFNSPHPHIVLPETTEYSFLSRKLSIQAMSDDSEMANACQAILWNVLLQRCPCSKNSCIPQFHKMMVDYGDSLISSWESSLWPLFFDVTMLTASVSKTYIVSKPNLTDSTHQQIFTTFLFHFHTFTNTISTQSGKYIENKCWNVDRVVCSERPHSSTGRGTSPSTRRGDGNV